MTCALETLHNPDNTILITVIKDNVAVAPDSPEFEEIAGCSGCKALSDCLIAETSRTITRSHSREHRPPCIHGNREERYLPNSIIEFP